MAGVALPSLCMGPSGVTAISDLDVQKYLRILNRVFCGGFEQFQMASRSRRVFGDAGMNECVKALREAFEKLAEEKVQLPLRSSFALQPEHKNSFFLMPCSIAVAIDPRDHIEDKKEEEKEIVYFGAKLLSVFPTNVGTRHESHQGIILLFEGKFGQLKAIADACSITQLRTAAASGLATDLLARKSDEDFTLALLGSGVQAVSHLEAMILVRKNIRKVKVWSKTFANAEKFVAESKQKYNNVEIIAVSTAREAVDNADIVCTLTGSPTPVVERSWLKPGVHINAVGAHTSKTRELASDVMSAASVFADKAESLLNESGDFLIPIQEGLYDEKHLKGDISQLVTDKISGRSSPSEITVFKSLGLAIEDLISVIHLYRRVSEQNPTTITLTSVH